jgi:hygromycin-B 4-O-kinase
MRRGRGTTGCSGTSGHSAESCRLESTVVQPSNEHPLAVERVTAFLQGRGWRPGSTISPIAHGEWSHAFSFATGGTAYIIRFSTLDEDFRKDQLAARFTAPALPIPRMLEVGQAFDGFYAISERAVGRFLDVLDAEQMGRTLPSLFAAIDEMRRSDTSGSSGFGLWDACGQAPHASWRDALLAIGTDTPGTRITGWRRRLEHSPTGAEPFDTAFDRLAKLSADLPDARHLLHADLLNYNVLIQGERVAAVLDWGAAMYGDWIFDVAWLIFWQPWYQAWSGIDFEAEATSYFASTGADVSDFGVRLRCCEIAIGLDNQAYCAFKGESRWPQLEAVARRTIELSC